MKVRGVWAENESGQKESKVIRTALTEGPIKDWVPVHAEQEYVIILEISRESFGFKVTVGAPFIDCIVLISFVWDFACMFLLQRGSVSSGTLCFLV